LPSHLDDNLLQVVRAPSGRLCKIQCNKIEPTSAF